MVHKQDEKLAETRVFKEWVTSFLLSVHQYKQEELHYLQRKIHVLTQLFD